MAIDQQGQETKKRILKEEESMGSFYEPDIRTSKECIGYYLIKKDLEFAKAALLLLKKEIDKYKLKNAEITLSDEQLVIQKSLWFSFIVSYGKAFKEARGRKVVLDAKDLKNSDPIALQLHNKVIAMRDKYVAHGDSSPNQTVKLYFYVEDNMVKIKYSNYFVYAQISEGLKMNLDLVIHVILICEEHIKRNESELRDKLRLYMGQNNNQLPPNGATL